MRHYINKTYYGSYQKFNVIYKCMYHARYISAQTNKTNIELNKRLLYNVLNITNISDSKELKKNYNDSLEKKQTVLETKVNAAVAALKNDLRTVGAGGRRFFEETIKSNKIVSEEKYKSDTPAIPGETYGSVIKTSVNASSNGKSYTNAVYLSMDFQGQI